VSIRVGEPVSMRYRSAKADTRRLMSAISELLPPEAHQPATPSVEELLATFPPGYRGDPTAEYHRRPGTD
jgi:putative phosphoserine phosphatase/1-acylglycerol-3-phosphate O-acyltransferase